jgi:3-oxoadipate CoA-transferase beta subunit
MGAFQVAENGDFANWSIPGTMIPAIGGAMDLASGAKHIWIMMDLFDRAGVSKLCEDCTYPLTARRVVERVYTDLAIFDISATGVVVRELVAGLTLEELQSWLPVEVRMESSH